MTPHWSEAYIGLPFDAERFNCADLAARVQAEQFGRAVDFPGVHPTSLLEMDAAITAHVDAVAEPVESPRDGDGVLLHGGGALRHVGIYCELPQGPAVLHAMARAGVVRHRLRDLPRWGLRVEGYYRFKAR